MDSVFLSKLEEEMKELVDAKEGTCECLLVTKHEGKYGLGCSVGMMSQTKSPQTILFFMAHIAGRLGLTDIFEPEFKAIADEMERERLLQDVYGQD